MSGDGRQAAWATFACPETGQTAPTVIHRACTRPGAAGEAAQGVRHERAMVSVVGFRGSEVVYSVGMAEGVFVTDLVGPPRAVPGLRRAASVDPVSGAIAGESEEGRARVVDPRTGRIRWRARGVRLDAFSPDGRAILGSGGRDGWAVYDAADGTLQHRIELPDRWRIDAVIWEDPRHLLLRVRARGESAVVRAGLRGGLERVTEPVPADRWGRRAFAFDFSRPSRPQGRRPSRHRRHPRNRRRDPG